MRTTLASAVCSLTLLALSGSSPCLGQPNPAFLKQSFQSPPASARPWVYWFWLNGNITSNGITADLEAMKRVGIGGALIMEVDQGAPVGPVDFMSPRWRDLFKHVHSEARRLGLEINMNNDAGWNGSGGPWIKPEQSMQKVVWSETNLVGPAHFEGPLSPPEKVAGFYKDIAVLAFPQVGGYRIPNIRPKAMFEIGWGGGISREKLPPEMVIDRDKLLTLTSRMDAQGRLTWDVPPGNWTVLRFGHTSTGVENAPAPKSGRGLECDKLSKEGIEANFAGLIGQLTDDNALKTTGAKSGLVATHIDSWENGSQNWTAKMPDEFLKRRGYELLPFLPVFTGRVVSSLEISERFLWDLRQTVSQMVIENYAGRMRELAHAHGLRFTVEAYGSPCDAIPYAGQSDEPMGEFWTPSGAIETCKAMASAAHVYGKRIVGAEAFTSGDQEKWREHPATLKAHGDQAFCEGINRFVFHRYALQPWAEERRPGMMMGPWGQHYERTQTWWDWTPAWHQYLARCQFMLRQGNFVADICYVQPEMPAQGPGDHPRNGYSWDECTTDAVLTRMSVKNGRIVLPDGMSYRLLVLPSSESMTPPLLRKVKELVRGGATVLGPKPSFSPSLTDFPACDDEVRQLARELWDHAEHGQAEPRNREQRPRARSGAGSKGRVLGGQAPDKILQADGVPADFASGQPLRFIHRQTADSDLYFVANPQPYEFVTTCTFRVAGKAPELWWPDSGRIEPAAVWESAQGVTRVSIRFEPTGSVFVVFRESARHQDPVVLVKRDGQTVLSAAPEPPVRVVVVKARYGVPDDPQRTRDVTAQIQARVDHGETAFPAKLMAESGDPAANVEKTLVVDYTIEGKAFTVKATDAQTIHLTREALRVSVAKARYGVLDDPKRTRDVRDKLQRLLDSGVSSFTVARMAEGDDPAFLVVKTLEFDVAVNGEHRHFTGTDPDTINLASPTVPNRPALAVHTDPKGRPILETHEAGEYQFVTASGKVFAAAATSVGASFEVEGPWQVRFAPGEGGPPSVMTFEKLGSWTEQTNLAVKYFSGQATYLKRVSAPANVPSRGQRVYLDLGRVRVMARVRLNGKDLGTLWKPPFRVDVTGVVRTGENELEIRVVNLWPNRLQGDEQLPEDSERNPDGTLKQWPQWLLDGKPSPTGRHTFCSWRLWKKGDALLESGLIGPVKLEVESEVPAHRVRGNGRQPTSLQR